MLKPSDPANYPLGALRHSARVLALCGLAVLLAAGAAQGQGAGSRERRPPLTMDELAAMASGPGLRGRIHGATHRQGAYVFTWTRPGNFFESHNLSLVAANPQVEAKLRGLERHQEALVRGKLKQDGYGSQPHILVEALEPGEKWSPGVVATPPRKAPGDLRETLSGKKSLTAMVHALSPDGGMLVVEWRDFIIPVQVPQAQREAVAQLFRGDRIRFRFTLAPHPKEPLHLLLDATSEGGRKPLEVRDALHAQHDQERTVTGRLVLFPKSPVLNRSIWAVEDRGENGLHRYFTIFNFSDLKDQDKIDAQLGGAWKAHPKGVLDGRNKYIHTQVRVRVSGKVSNPARNQANPTVVTTSDRVEVLAPRAQ